MDKLIEKITFRIKYLESQIEHLQKQRFFDSKQAVEIRSDKHKIYKSELDFLKSIIEDLQ